MDNRTKMTQEEKNLLLKDLSSRLPYGCCIGNEHWNKWELSGIELSSNLVMFKQTYNNMGIISVEEIKPFLRPMSSMTDEEKDYVIHLAELPCAAQICEKKVDFFLSHHIDWRGLIPKGLALEAPKDMYKEKYIK